MNGSQSQSDAPKERVEPIVSLRERDGTMVEMTLDTSARQSRLVVFRDGRWSEQTSVVLDGRRHVPYSPRNNLLTHRVILLASAVGEYSNDRDLLDEVREFIHRYVDLEPAFEEVAAHYVLMTWGYDTFNEVPYLRVRGDYGSGKSRFLLTVGSICYKPLFASGASTVSPIFRLIDQVGGTLVVDEADFRFSDERAEITKILNCGFARGFPVLRSEATPTKEFNPRAFDIFGPKIVATRHGFEDEALESRCLTAILGERPVRPDVPVTLPRAFEAEATDLRNRLLAYRFRRFSRPEPLSLEADPDLEPRRAQISAALLSVAATAESRERLRDFVCERPAWETDDRSDTEGKVLEVAEALLHTPSGSLSLQAIAKGFEARWGTEYGVEVSPKWIGSVLRRLEIRPQKTNGIYAIPVSEYPRLRKLFVDHGLGDFGEDRDISGGTGVQGPA